MFTFPLTWVNNKCIRNEYKEHETLSSICIEGNCHAYVVSKSNNCRKKLT